MCTSARTCSPEQTPLQGVQGEPTHIQTLAMLSTSSGMHRITLKGDGKDDGVMDDHSRHRRTGSQATGRLLIDPQTHFPVSLHQLLPRSTFLRWKSALLHRNP